MIGAALAMAAVGLMPAPAAATITCVADTGNRTVDEKIVGETCWDCGWVMIRGKAYTLFYCGRTLTTERTPAPPRPTLSLTPVEGGSTCSA